MRGTLGSSFASHLVQQLFNPLRICRLRPGVSCGMNSRRAAESRHNQARVVGKHQPIRSSRVVQRLARRIFGKRRSIFLERGKCVEIRQ